MSVAVGVQLGMGNGAMMNVGVGPLVAITTWTGVGVALALNTGVKVALGSRDGVNVGRGVGSTGSSAAVQPPTNKATPRAAAVHKTLLRRHPDINPGYFR